MKQSIFKLTFIVLAGTFVMACAKLPIYESQYKTPTSNEPGQHMNGESKMMYTVEHDAENLYLIISTSDMMTQSRILAQGLTIWLDQNAKKNEIIGFTYPFPMGQQEQSETQNTNREQRGSMDDTSSRSQKMFKRFEKGPKPIKLMGFENLGSVQLLNPELEPSPVLVNISMTDGGIMTYSATIPLSSIFTNADVSKSDLSIGVFADAPAMPQGRPDMSESGGGRPSGGGQGGQGGGPPGGGGGGGGRPSGGQGGGGMSAPKEINFWFQVNLNGVVQ